MNKLRIIIFSFISILLVGIGLTYSLINYNIESGVHRIELENKDVKSIEVSIDKKSDTVDVNNDISVSVIEKDYAKSVFSFLTKNIDLKSGLYKFTF